MYYQSRNSLPYFASALVAFFFKFLFALHSFKSHYIYDKRENNKGVFFSSAGQKVSSARVNLRWYTRRCTSFQRPCPPSLPRKFSFTCTTYKYTYIEKTMQRCVYFVYSVGCLIHRSTFHYPFTYRKTEVENVSENVQRLVWFLILFWYSYLHAEIDAFLYFWKWVQLLVKFVLFDGNYRNVVAECLTLRPYQWAHSDIGIYEGAEA